MALPLTVRPAGCGELLQILRDGVPRSRADLVALTGHARSTIGTRIDALLPTGLVRTEAASSTGGRPPSVYAFDPAARTVLAVDLGAVHLAVAVLDLHGSVLAADRTDCDITEGPEPVLAQVVKLSRRLLAQLCADILGGHRLCGGIGELLSRLVRRLLAVLLALLRLGIPRLLTVVRAALLRGPAVLLTRLLLAVSRLLTVWRGGLLAVPLLL